MPQDSEEFYRIGKLPPYVFAVINEMRARARAAQIDVIDLGMGNPDGATPRIIVNKMIEASRLARNHRYSQSRGIPRLREEIVKRYDKVLIPELNTGQLRLLIRAKFLVDAQGLNKIQGKPFVVHEVATKIDEVLESQKKS
jgi:hypothetical protein